MVKRFKRPLTLIGVCFLYGLISLFSAFSMVNKYKKDNSQKFIHFNFFTKDAYLEKNHKQDLEIWDPSGVGLYLWKHILQGQVSNKPFYEGWYGGFQSVGNLNMTYKFRNGFLPYNQAFSPKENMFIVLNGRNLKKVKHCKAWLDFLISHKDVSNLGLLLLGDESCNNNWLKYYLLNSKLRVVFHIYDSPLIDNKRVFGWPLGVASYRNFPLIEVNDVWKLVNKTRVHFCNFIGTIYPGTSRERLKNFIEENNFICDLTWRKERTEEETIESALRYQRILSSSDLTLSPAGRNSECYRTYEAIELGSIPVVEDVSVPESCNNSGDFSYSPYKILKKYKAPIIYVKNWTNELPQILHQYNVVSDVIDLRNNLRHWYAVFKEEMKDLFVDNVYNLFIWKRK